MKISNVLSVAAATIAMMGSKAAATTIFFSNMCPQKMELWDNLNSVSLDPGANHAQFLPVGFIGKFQSGRDTRATLAEFSVTGPSVWYDISIIPPKPGHCGSLAECMAVSGGVGFNVAMSITPRSGTNSHCRGVTCMANGCADAYKFPNDNSNTHDCAAGTDFDVVFCPGGPGGSTTAPPATTLPPTTTPPPKQTTQAPDTTSPPPSQTPPAFFAETRSRAAEYEDSILGATFTPSNATDPVSTVAAPTEATDAGATSAPGTAAPAEEVKTQASGSSGGHWTSVVAVLLPVAAAAGVAAIVARHKKAQLDALDDKSPMESPMEIVEHTRLSTAVL